VKEINRQLKVNYGVSSLEKFYENISPKVLIEDLLVDEYGNIPNDFKFHCFQNTGHRKIVIQVDYDRWINHGQNFYDEGWNLLPLEILAPCRNSNIQMPANFKKMKELALILSEDFNYVRVDLYNLNGLIYFGELTFCHLSGFGKFKPHIWDKVLGNYWEFEIDKKSKLII
jgi:hypothetical protein